MYYMVIEKTTLMLVCVESVLPPEGAYGDHYIIPKPENLVVSLPVSLPDGGYIPGTIFTQTQIDTLIAKYETLLAKQEEAITSAIALVNGTAISDLTFTQLKILLLILCAERGWITVTNKINVTT